MALEYTTVLYSFDQSGFYNPAGRTQWDVIGNAQLGGASIDSADNTWGFNTTQWKLTIWSASLNAFWYWDGRNGDWTPNAGDAYAFDNDWDLDNHVDSVLRQNQSGIIGFPIEAKWITFDPNGGNVEIEWYNR